MSADCHIFFSPLITAALPHRSQLEQRLTEYKVLTGATSLKPYLGQTTVISQEGSVKANLSTISLTLLPIPP